MREGLQLIAALGLFPCTILSQGRVEGLRSSDMLLISSSGQTGYLHLSTGYSFSDKKKKIQVKDFLHFIYLFYLCTYISFPFISRS